MKTVLCTLLLASVFSLPCLAATRVEDVPEKGLQPEVAVAKDGAVHLVYLRGEPKAAEVRHTWRQPGKAWQPSQTVNSVAGSGIAMGSIRGPQLALGGQGAVHVLWNGAAAHGAPRTPLWYARGGGAEGKFEEQRDLLEDSTALDGGASITTDAKGAVFVVWHGNKAGAKPEESDRLVFVRTSRDGGKTFGKPAPANAGAPGVCACCSLRALAGPGDALNIFFRNAAKADHRAMTLLTGSGGKAQTREVEPWKINACPMSSAALTFRQNRLLGAWETAGQIRAGWISETALSPVTAAGQDAKHPAIAVNAAGNILVAWVEGSGWNRGGSAAWQEFDAQLKPVGERGESKGVPAWGKVAAYAEPNGDFVVLR